MISSELPEILGMSDRIAVMRAGRIRGVLDRAEATQAAVWRWRWMNSLALAQGSGKSLLSLLPQPHIFSLNPELLSMPHRREVSVALAIVALGLVLAVAAPGFFARDNLSDLFLANLPVLIVALGMTLVILTGQIDISVGSVFAICGVVAGLLAKTGLPMPLVAVAACLVGAALGGLNGALVAYVRIPSIVVTLATMVALRDGLRWATQGAWMQDLPASFQWLGLTQASYPFVASARRPR